MKLSVKVFPSHGSPAPAHDTQLRELKWHLDQPQYGSAKDYHHQLITLCTKTQALCDKLWKTLMMAKIAAATLKSFEFTYTGQNSAHALPEWGLRALQIFLDSFPSQSRITQKEDLIHATDLSFQPKGKEKNTKKRKPFPCSRKTGYPWVTLPKNYLSPTLWKRSETVYQ